METNNYLLSSVNVSFARAINSINRNDFAKSMFIFLNGSVAKIKKTRHVILQTWRQIYPEHNNYITEVLTYLKLLLPTICSH